MLSSTTHMELTLGDPQVCWRLDQDRVSAMEGGQGSRGACRGGVSQGEDARGRGRYERDLLG